jgi:hypothetical protein
MKIIKRKLGGGGGGNSRNYGDEIKMEEKAGYVTQEKIKRK